MLWSLTKSKVRERRQQGSVALAGTVNCCRARQLFVFCRTCLLVETLPRTCRWAASLQLYQGKMDNELWRRDPNRQHVHFEGASADLFVHPSVCLSVSMHEFNSELHFCPPLSTGSGYSSVQHSLRARQPLNRLSSWNEVSPQWDWGSAPAAASQAAEDEPAQDLRCTTLPMSMKRALRYGTLACGCQCSRWNPRFFVCVAALKTKSQGD